MTFNPAAINFNNIPSEMLQYPNWVCWRYVDIENSNKKTKVPFHPTGFKASVNDPKTWSTFNDCFNAFSFGGWDGLGFMFSHSPYTGIDLDDPQYLADGFTPNPNYQQDIERQIKIHHEFDSYSEVSPSGKGLHIIIRGEIASGRRRDKIEIYSTGRFFTMTGNVHANKPIADRQDLLWQLWQQMSDNRTEISNPDKPEVYSDAQIIDMALSAANGEKFAILNSGAWQQLYASQSEADFAYVDIIAFYSRNKAQISRIFKASPLGKRDKADRKDYVSKMVERAFDKMPPNIDFDGLNNSFEDIKAKLNPPSTTSPTIVKHSKEEFELTVPPGLMGEIAQFVYQSAPRPVKEIAIAAAIGLMAGVCGRAYNYSGTGLNQYILTLAKTGRGKEAAAIGIDKLMNAIKSICPTSPSFRGPGIINSGQALTKYLNTTSKCFVSVLGEFGITIDRISSPYANSADKMLYQALLDLYNKSGHGQTYQPSIYSKKEDNVGLTNSPAVTILGESTHKLFYSSLNEDMISAGLLPRFLIIEYNGDRVPLNEGHVNVVPSFNLTDRLSSLIAHVETIMRENRVINVGIEQDALSNLRSFDKSADTLINATHEDAIAELWNRAHMKVMRLSALIAVGVNPFHPVIENHHIEWAKALVQNDIKTLSNRFERGEIGKNTSENKQVKEVLRMVKDYYNREWDFVKKYSKDQAMYIAHVIPAQYFNKRLSNTAAFNDGKVRASVAINNCLQLLANNDVLREVPRTQLMEVYKTQQKCYVLHDFNILYQD